MVMRFKLLFRGQVAADQHPAVVRGRLQKLLKASDAQLDVMFSGKPVAIKKAADEATAERYKEAFVKAGAKLEIVELDAAVPAAPMPKANVLVTPQPQKAPSPGPAEEQRRLQAAAGTVSGRAIGTDSGASFALAEVGADLAPGATRIPDSVAKVPTDHLSLATLGGNLMETAEIAAVEPLPRVDTSHLSLDKPGATLGVPSSAATDIEVLKGGDFELGEVGELLVESTVEVVRDVPDLSHLVLESLPKASDEELA